MIQEIDETVVQDIVEIIPDANDASDVVSDTGSDVVSDTGSDAGSDAGSACETTDDEEYDSDEEYGSDEDFIRVDDIGNPVERVVDVLGSIFITSDGSTLADVLYRINDTLEKHVAAVEAQTAILEKQSKVLFKLAKVIESK
jgi:hypothetical protein